MLNWMPNIYNNGLYNTSLCNCLPMPQTYPNYGFEGMGMGCPMINLPTLDQIAYNRFSGQAPATIQSLSTTQAKLEELLTSDLLTADQKSRIQTVIDAIKNAKAEVANIARNANSRAEQIYALEAELANLQTAVQTLTQSLTAEVQQSAQNNQSGQAQQAQQSEQAEQNNQAAQPVVDEQLENELQELENKAVDICKNIYDGAIGCGVNDGTGTDYNKIKQGTNQINKDNVAAVLTMWNQQYVESGIVGDKNGMIETLFAEECFWNPSLDEEELGADKKFANPKNNMQIIWNIVKCLEEKARELNIYNGLAAQFTVAYDELDDTFVDQSAVENAVNDIAEKVFAAQQEDMLTKAAQRQQQAQQTPQADNNQDNNNNNAELDTRRAFQNDMRRVFNDENAKISDRVRYENGQFVVRIEGRNYAGSSFSELAKAVKDAGYDAKQYLTKQQLRAAA